MTDPTDPHRLVVRRFIRATPKRLFEAWTTPSQLLSWWGPRGVRCTIAEIDLRVGGRYRLGNELPDGRVVVIAGEFLAVEPPRELTFTWCVDSQSAISEHVTVRFHEKGEGTEVVVVHERIADAATRKRHADGWEGCLDGLAAFTQ